MVGIPSPHQPRTGWLMGNLQLDSELLTGALVGGLLPRIVCTDKVESRFTRLTLQRLLSWEETDIEIIYKNLDVRTGGEGYSYFTPSIFFHSSFIRLIRISKLRQTNLLIASPIWRIGVETGVEVCCSSYSY